MTQTQLDEIKELNDQLLAMWSCFARPFPTGRVESLPGMAIALSGAPMAFLNLIVFSTPIQHRADLVERCERARRIGAECGAPWLLSTCDAWIGNDHVAKTTLSEMGFVTVTPTSGMIADAIAPPRRDLPADLTCARVSSDETRQAFADLNAMSYAIPLETGRQGPARACFWDNSFHGYVALLGGEPVSAAMTAPMDGRLYVSWVATHPEHRRKGYADAVMRKSLESAHLATGFTRTALHATPDGQPIYERMGYRSIAGFSLHAVA